jgi:outer membrane protein TolC
VLFVFTSKAQTVLSLDQAIKTALEKNYGLQQTKNLALVSKSQNNAGNAGLSPTVSLNTAFNFSKLNSHQEFSSGTIQDKDGAISKNIGASVNANWTVFDGFKMFAVKKRLDANTQAAETNVKMGMENTVFQTIVYYHAVVKIKALIKSAEQNFVLVQERNKLASVKYSIGSDSKMDFLLAEGNERRIKSDLSQLQIQLLNAKTQLNILLNRSADEAFDTPDSIVVNFNPSLEDLKRSAGIANKSLLLSKQNEIQLQQSMKEASALQLPQVQLNTAYNFTRNQSQAGFVFLNRQAGLNAGISASWLIFNGNKTNRLVQERKLLLLNQELSTAQTKLQLDAAVYLQYEAYLLNKKSLAYEFENLQMAKEVLAISLQRYKLGKAAIIETLDMQNNYEQAQSRYINSLYNLKIGEAELLRAAGLLVK